MSLPFVAWIPRPELLTSAAAVGVLASIVALRLMGGIAEVGLRARLRRIVSAAVALATGVWSVHMIVVPGDSGSVLLAGFGAAVVAAAMAQFALIAPLRVPVRLPVAAIALGTGLCLAQWIALAPLRQGPAIGWGLVCAWLLACAGAGAAFLLVPLSARVRGRGATLRMPAAALLLGATMVAVEMALIVATRVSAAPVDGAAGPMGGREVNLLLFGGPLVLMLLWLLSIIEERYRDILASARDELRRATYTDALTSLPNRLLFEERLARAVSRADRAQRRMALLFINLDGLKGVNEHFGQSAGDALLREIAQRLRGLSGRELLARVGGDEFLLLIEDNPDLEEVSRRAARVLDEIALPCTIELREVAVSASIGIAMYPEHGALSRLVPHAAAALHAAKRMGGATYCFFEAGMVAGKREEIELLHDLRCAIEQRQLELYYQPKVHAPSGEITGAEALLRWHHPQRGMISPMVFIPLAEHYGLINTLGEWVIEDACRQIRAWRNQGLRMRVAINLSVHQLHQSDLAAHLASALKRNRLEPRVLTCEITESIAMDDKQSTLDVIKELAAVGVQLSIDDFGTGYSNLSCLRKLPAKEIKIDRGFVLDLETSSDARAIVDAVVKLAQALGLKVVAEGVETERQQRILSQFGCDELQGYVFAKPMSADALAHWAMSREGPRALDFRASLFGETRPFEVG